MIKLRPSVLTAAALSTMLLSSVASAQSNVTVYGRVDLGLAQYADAAGSLKVREIRQGSASRLGFRGTEDMGGGLIAFFDLHHRFDPDTGIPAARFWEGQSIVGIGHPSWGRLYLGRTETPSYLLVEVVADPFGADTVAQNATLTRGRIGTNRVSNSVNYRGVFGGFTLQAQIADKDDNAPTAGITGVNTSTGRFITAAASSDKRPYSVAATYAAGAVYVGAGYENPADKDDKWFSLHGSYNFGPVKIGGFIGDGKNSLADKVRGYLFSVTAPIGVAELRVSYGLLENRTRHLTNDKQFGIGYHHPLSKRTTLYADFVRQNRDGIANGSGANELQRSGYDFGIKHNF